jgi:hypothetical protein
MLVEPFVEPAAADADGSVSGEVLDFGAGAEGAPPVEAAPGDFQFGADLFDGQPLVWLAVRVSGCPGFMYAVFGLRGRQVTIECPNGR